MDKKYTISDKALSLRYGLAIVTFGKDAVEKVICQPKWAKKYPEIFQELGLGDMAQKNIILPGEIIYEIAGRDECLDDYYADPDGERLYAVGRTRTKTERSAAESQGDVKIPNQEALVTYGAYCLFAASDKGTGYKGEQGLLTDHSSH